MCEIGKRLRNAQFKNMEYLELVFLRIAVSRRCYRRRRSATSRFCSC